MFINILSRVDVATDVWAYDFENATKHSIDLFVSLFILRSERLKLVDPTFPTGISKFVRINLPLEYNIHSLEIFFWFLKVKSFS